MRGRFLAIAGVWIMAAVFSVYSALALHSSSLAIVSFLFAVCGTLILRPRTSVEILRVVYETEEGRLVESSLGLSVRMTNSSIVYREGARCITIRPFTEPGKPVAFRMAPDIPLAWDPPNEDNPISPKEQAEIRRRIVAFRSCH